MKKIFAWIVFALYIGVFIYFAERRLFAYTYTVDRINMIPFVTMIDYVRQWQIGHVSKLSIIYNIIGNILLLLPLGIVIPIMNEKAKRSKVVLAIGAIISLIIEVVQFVYSCGVCDIDDILLNTIGLLIGFALYKGLTHHI